MQTENGDEITVLQITKTYKVYKVIRHEALWSFFQSLQCCLEGKTFEIQKYHHNNIFIKSGYIFKLTICQPLQIEKSTWWRKQALVTSTEAENAYFSINRPNGQLNVHNYSSSCQRNIFLVTSSCLSPSMAHVHLK